MCWRATDRGLTVLSVISPPAPHSSQSPFSVRKSLRRSTQPAQPQSYARSQSSSCFNKAEQGDVAYLSGSSCNAAENSGDLTSGEARDNASGRCQDGGAGDDGAVGSLGGEYNLFGSDVDRLLWARNYQRHRFRHRCGKCVNSQVSCLFAATTALLGAAAAVMAMTKVTRAVECILTGVKDFQMRL